MQRASVSAYDSGFLGSISRATTFMGAAVRLAKNEPRLLVLAVLIFNAAFTFLRTTYYTCLYLWAIAAETSSTGLRLKVPAPLAEAFS
jgi:hypothetical protein